MKKDTFGGGGNKSWSRPDWMKENRGRTVMRKMEEDVSYRSLVWIGNRMFVMCSSL